MRLPQVSMRTQIGGLVLFMGLISLGLALLTGEYYRQLIFQDQRASLEHIGAAKANDLLQRLEAGEQDLALSLQNAPRFRRAFLLRNPAALKAAIAKVYARYMALPGALKVDSLYVVDDQFRMLAGVDSDDSGQSRCAGILARAAMRPLAERVNPFSALCTQSESAQHILIVPVRDVRTQGYIAVVTDPEPVLQMAEESLVMPLRLRVGDHAIYTSPRWPKGSGEDLMVASVDLAADGIAPLTMEMASDTKLGILLARARLVVMGAAGVATFALMLLALTLINRSTLHPLRHLTQRMRLVRGDRSLLGTQITPVGNAEMREFAENFNELSADLRDLQQTLESLAYNDHLTGLPNRVLFRDRLEQQMRLAEREHGAFAVMAIDLDGFKQINDTLGHHAGDLLLQQVAQRLKRSLRKSDTLAFAGNTVARLGGDEFCVLLPSVSDSKEAVVVADKLMRTLDKEFVLEGQKLRVGMSIGIALFPQHARDMEGLSRTADSAMYVAKRNGGGYATFGSPMYVKASA